MVRCFQTLSCDASVLRLCGRCAEVPHQQSENHHCLCQECVFNCSRLGGALSALRTQVLRVAVKRDSPCLPFTGLLPSDSPPSLPLGSFPRLSASRNKAPQPCVHAHCVGRKVSVSSFEPTRCLMISVMSRSTKKKRRTTRKEQQPTTTDKKKQPQRKLESEFDARIT